MSDITRFEAIESPTHAPQWSVRVISGPRPAWSPTGTFGRYSKRDAQMKARTLNREALQAADAVAWLSYTSQREGGPSLNMTLAYAAPGMLAALKLAESVCEDAVRDATFDYDADPDNLAAAKATLAAVVAAIARAEGRA